jgi:hypothetical protein
MARFFRIFALALFCGALLALRADAADSVKPFRDGHDGFLEMARLIKTADNFVHYVAWGFDDEMSWAAGGPRPTLRSRQNGLTPPPPGSAVVEDLMCGRRGAPDPNSLISLMRCKAAAIAIRNQNLHPKTADDERGEVMVLVWNQELDLNNLAPPLNNLDDISYVLVPYNALVTWPKAVLNTQMRSRGSGESLRMLLTFQNAYKNPALKALFANTNVVMPTGVQLMVQKNQNKGNLLGTASHHQKLLITEAAAFVGGLNTFKEYWDTDTHVQDDMSRWQSVLAGGGTTLPGVLASSLDFTKEVPWAAIPPPLHDTGAIVQGDVVGGVNALFKDRWMTNFNPQFASNATTLPALPAAAQKAIKVVAIAAPAGIKQMLNALATPQLKSTPFFYLKRAMLVQWLTSVNPLNPNASFNAGLVTNQLRVALDAQEAKLAPIVGAPASVADPNALTKGPASFVVSHPDHAYQPAGPSSFAIRAKYYNVISNLGVGSFSYFENQFVGDHEFAKTLFAACKPRAPGDPDWCRADAFAHFVIPYVPGGSGITILDLYKVVPDTVKDEMQNLEWLEVKSARSVRDRTTDTLWRTLTPMKAPCTPNNPDIRFVPYADPKNPKILLDPNTDPSLVTLNTDVMVRGNDPAQPCPGHPGETLQQPPATKKLRDIIVDAAIMSYVLASNPPSKKTAIPTTYDAFLARNAIYVHSKHSEFWTMGGMHASTYVVGSANLNTRSLGDVKGQTDSNDSEDAIFWTPGDNDTYWQDIWREHEQQPIGADFGNDIRDWEKQGWSNYDILRKPGAGIPLLTGRVVRLDAVGRCIALRCK